MLSLGAVVAHPNFIVFVMALFILFVGLKIELFLFVPVIRDLFLCGPTTDLSINFYQARRAFRGLVEGSFRTVMEPDPGPEALGSID